MKMMFSFWILSVLGVCSSKRRLETSNVESTQTKTITPTWGNFHFAIGSLVDVDTNFTYRDNLPVGLYTTEGRNDNKSMLWDNAQWRADHYVSHDKCDFNGKMILDNSVVDNHASDALTENAAIMDVPFEVPPLPHDIIGTEVPTDNIQHENIENPNKPLKNCSNVLKISDSSLILDGNQNVVGFMTVLKSSTALNFITAKEDSDNEKEEKNLKLLQHWSKMLNKYLKENNVTGFSGIIIGKRSKGLKTLVSEIYPFDLPDGFYGVLLGIPDSQKNKAVFNVSDRLHSLHWSSENEEWIESVRCMNEALVENKKWYVTKPGDIRYKLKSKICLVSAEPSSSYATDSSQWIELESKNKTNAYLVPISDNEADTNADHYSKFC